MRIVQPNIHNLIHQFANGRTQQEMRCGNVSSGGGELYTYSTMLARHYRKDNLSVFLLNVTNYSKTSNKHRAWFRNSIHSKINWCRIFDAYNASGLTSSINFTDAAKRFARELKTGGALLVNYTGGKHSYVYHAEYVLNALTERMRNKRTTACLGVDIADSFFNALAAMHLAKIEGNVNVRPIKNALRKFKPAAYAYMKRWTERDARLNAEDNAAREAAESKLEAVLTAADSSERLLQAVQKYKQGVSKWQNGESITDSGCNVYEFAKENQAELNEVIDVWKTLSKLRDGVSKFRSFVELLGYCVERLTGCDSLNVDHVRIKDGELQTTRGVVLPETIVRHVFRKIEKELTEKEHVFNPPVMVGPYPITSVENGKVIIGCHKISQTELMGLAVSREW